MGKASSKQKLKQNEKFETDFERDQKVHDSLQSSHKIVSPNEFVDLDLELALDEHALSDETAMFIHKVSKRIRKNITVLKSETPEAQAFDEQNFLLKKWSVQTIQCNSYFPIINFQDKPVLPQKSIPTVSEIENFLTVTLSELALPIETLVISMIYIDRLLTTSFSRLSTSNWRPITYAALLVANKAYQDICKYPRDFAECSRWYSVNSICKLESLMLDSLDWKVIVIPEDYAQYYWALQGTELDEDRAVSSIITMY